ncbi:hypothetical protein HAHE_29320 [Haloferula helveola]|uniref:Protein kinase domain-containing protein n=1 Tax=Haloferula helveola TaxID=490095 RepID=A0ABM7REM4_9BACT|nr:hypothetical protein HAHE_29320 [Haloferula helveola]
MSTPESRYTPDRRLERAYEEANLLDDSGLEALCPSYIELAESDVRYRDETSIGMGSLKEVSKCWDCRARRWVAMARLREDRGAEFYDLFVNEAWVSSSLNHPNIINIYDVGVDGVGRPYFTMDLKGETTLGDVIRERGMSGRRELLGIFLRICDAVSYAHDHGFLHLDLKPGNIQADRFGEVLVCDWGLAKKIAEPESADDGLPFPGQKESVGNITLHGEIKGTLGYMAPEQIVPAGRKDVRTDVFALGCVLHEILTGVPPFTGTSQEELLAKTARGTFPPPHLRHPQRMVPESLSAVVLKACTADPEQRYDSVAELASEVSKYLGGHATVAEEPGFFRASALFLRRHKLPASIFFGAIAVVIVVSGLFLQRISVERLVTESERGRARELEDEAGRLAARVDESAARIESHLAETAQSREELAAKLAKSANSLKNLGVFSAPAKSIPEARGLAKVALSLDPTNQEASFETFVLSCIQLDFRSALEAGVPKKHEFAGDLKLARKFRHFDFSGSRRPSPEQLAGFFRKARTVHPGRDPLMERILSYDHAVRKSSAGIEPVMGLVEYMNGGGERVIGRYDPDHRALFLWSDRPLVLALQEGAGSGDCVLKYAPVLELTLDLRYRFNLSSLNALPVRRLDLRKCENLVFPNRIELRDLEEVRILPGQINPALLRSRIDCRRRFEIVVEE